VADLNFLQARLQNFRVFIGTHVLDLSKPGLYYVTGDNKDEPSLGSNGLGKSTLFDSVLWCLYGVTGSLARPSSTVLPWAKYKAAGPTSVAVTFIRDEIEHTVERGRKPNYLRLDGTVVEQAAIDRALGLRETTFRRAVILSQFEELFLDMTPEAQSQLFTEVLNLDLWLKASRIASDYCGRAQALYEETQASVASLDGQLKVIQEQLQGAKLREASFKAETATALKNETDALQEAEAELRVLKPPTVPKDIDLAADGGKALERAISELQDKLTKAAQARGAASAANAALLQQITKANKEVAGYQAAITGAKTCPECGQKVSTAHLTTKLKEKQNALAELDCQVVAQQELAKTAGQAWNELTKQKAAKVGEVEKLRAVRIAFDTDQRRFNDERAVITGAIQMVQENIRRLKSQTNPHSQTVKELAVTGDKTQADFAVAQKELTACGVDVENLKFWIGGFKEIRLSLIESVLLGLDIAANNHADALGLKGWTIKFSTTRETASGNVSTKFTAELIPPGGTEAIPFQSYSGGERQRWNLAVTFGLGETLLATAGVQANLLGLDEPTRHLSGSGVDDLLAYLVTLAREQSKAVYVVEHHSLDKGLFDQVLLIEKDAHGAHISVGGKAASIQAVVPVKLKPLRRVRV